MLFSQFTASSQLIAIFVAGAGKQPESACRSPINASWFRNVDLGVDDIDERLKSISMPFETIQIVLGAFVFTGKKHPHRNTVTVLLHSVYTVYRENKYIYTRTSHIA